MDREERQGAAPTAISGGERPMNESFPGKEEDRHFHNQCYTGGISKNLEEAIKGRYPDFTRDQFKAMVRLLEETNTTTLSDNRLPVFQLLATNSPQDCELGGLNWAIQNLQQKRINVGIRGVYGVENLELKVDKLKNHYPELTRDQLGNMAKLSEYMNIRIMVIYRHTSEGLVITMENKQFFDMLASIV